MMTDRKVFSRRSFLQMAATAVVGAAGVNLLAACGGSSAGTATIESSPSMAPTASGASVSTATSAGEETKLGASLIGEIEGPTIVTDPSKWPKTFNEAPQLAELVKQGKLPPVAERIGQDPIVVQPLHEIGRYGGTWHRGFTGPGDKWNGYRAAGMDTLIGWHYTAAKQVPNIAKSWEFSDDGRVLTLHLRRGMKWSDGEPFTADDFVFWFEDMYGNDELMPVKPVDMSINGNPGRLEKIDDYTIRFVFPDPYFLLVDKLAGAGPLGGQAVMGLSANGTYAPAHYLKQFHPKYADPAELDRLVQEAGVDNWVTLFKQKNDWTLNPDLPVITPWKTVSPINSTTWRLERNPYSIWVDTEGNQLPYIDEIVMTLAENLEVLNLRAIAGEYDFQARHIDLSKLPVFLENQEKGNYRVYLDLGDYGSDMCIYINQSYEADSEIGKWLRTADFRRALSLGIDRDQLNETFWLGTGTPGSPVPSETNRYNPGPEYRTLWHTYDPEKANAMLDRLGLDQRDSEGFRQRTDGKGRLRLEIITNGGQFIQFTQIAEVIAQQWREIGIELIVREVERSLSDTIINANEHQLYAWNNDGSEDVFQSPKCVIPRAGDPIGPLYGLWYATNGREGKEPPPPLRAAIEKFRQGFVAPEEERIRIGKELWADAVDQVNAIGIVGLSAASQGVRIVKNSMGNVPARQYNSPIVKNPCISCPPTFFFRE